MEQHSHEQNVSKIAEMIKDVRVAMLTTVEHDGSLRSRPMATQNSRFDGTLWFFTDASSPKVQEILHNQQVNVSYSDPGDQKYVSVSGTAQLVRDRAKAEELWTPFHLAWFPKGVDDPSMALLAVDVEKAEYWDSPSSTMVHLVGFVKALATGKRYGAEGADHEKVQL